MDAAFVVEWLNLMLRWAHMIVGIAWIGASFYFIWLDNHLHPPLDPADAAKGIGGEVWAVHGGGFYTAKKFALAPEKLPPELHWFKWEAYTTLITGFFLLCLVYYYGAEVALIDPAVMPLTKPEAIAIGLGFLVLGWLVYDGLCRSAFGEDDAILGGLLFVYCAVVGLGALPSVLGPRRLHPFRRHARHHHGAQRLLRDHPRPARAGEGQGGRPHARSEVRR